MKDDAKPRVPNVHVLQQIRDEVETRVKVALNSYVGEKVTAQMIKNVEITTRDTLQLFIVRTGVREGDISLECVRDPDDDTRVLIIPGNDFTKDLLIPKLRSVLKMFQKERI